MNKETLDLINKIKNDIIKMFDNKEIVELDNDMQTIDNNLNDYFDNLVNNLKLQDTITEQEKHKTEFNNIKKDIIKRINDNTTINTMLEPEMIKDITQDINNYFNNLKI